MEINTHSRLAQPALPGISSPRQAVHSLNVPGSQFPAHNPSHVRSFVANAERLASFEASAKFLSLNDILVIAKLSHSSAYAYGLVPKYDKVGKPVESKKIPPFPWVQLPPAIVMKGKKLWDEADITEWHRCICARSRQSAIDPARNNKVQREVMP
jgi:hypothetical protein